MRAVRLSLATVGILVIVLGVVVLFATNRPAKILGLGSWLVLAIVAHDVVVAAITFAVSSGLRRAGRAVPAAVLAIAQGAIVVASVFAIVVLPEAYKKSIGTGNPTVLPLDYLTALLALWAGIAVAAGLGIVASYAARARRQKTRASDSQT